MYKLYIGDTLFPVTPEHIKTKIENRNKVIDLVNDVEVNLLKAPGLSSFDFEMLIPNRKYPFAHYDNGFVEAERFMDVLEILKVNKKPFKFRLLKNGDGEDLSIDVSLESYNVQDDGYGFIVSVVLKQFIPYGTKTVTLKKKEDGKVESNTTSKRPESSKTPLKTYTVKSGDNLYNIAKKYLGNANRRSEIYKLNKSVIESTAKKHGRSSSSNGWWIYTGTKLKMPKK